MSSQGLGTSTSADAKKYFNAIDRHRLGFDVIKPEDRALIDMAFNKKKADDRKEWLRQFKVSARRQSMRVFYLISPALSSITTST